MHERRRLAAIVWAVLVSQVLLYPGLAETVRALGASGDLAGMWFLVAEFGAFVACAVVWGSVSDALGRRTTLIVVGAAGGAASYAAVAPAGHLELAIAVLAAPWVRSIAPSGRATRAADD